MPCKTCKHWWNEDVWILSDGKEIGAVRDKRHCRYNPPSIIGQATTIWPLAAPHWECGQYKPIPKPKPTNVSEWRNSFGEYLDSCSKSLTEIKNDTEWITAQQSIYPDTDIIKSLDKAYYGFWRTQKGWEYKKKKKTTKLNWKTTWANAIPINKVPKNIVHVANAGAYKYRDAP